MQSRMTLVLGALILALGMGQVTAEATTSGRASAGSESKQMPFRGKVVKVDLEAKTISLSGKERDRVFLVTEQSKINKNGQKCSLAEVQAGDQVGGLARSHGEQWEIVTLNVGPKPERPSEQAGS